MNKYYFLNTALIALFSMTPLLGKAQTVRNPLEQVAEFNLKSDGTFVSGDPKTAVGDYFSWDETQTAITPKDYHIPSRDEALVIVGQMAIGEKDPFTPYANFTWKQDDKGKETVSIWGETKTYDAHYKSFGNDIAYAIRFKGGDNKYLSAYKWEVLLKGGSVQDDFGPMRLIYGIKVTCRLLGDAGKDVAVDDISKPEYWETNNTKDVVRFIPAGGFRDGDNIDNLYVRGRYWTKSEWTSPRGSKSGYGFGFDENWAFVYAWMKKTKYNLRLFKNKATTGVEIPLQCDGQEVNFVVNRSSIHSTLPLSFIEIYNINGEKVFQSSLESDLFDVSFAGGIYIIRYKASVNESFQTTRIIVK